MLQSCFTQYYTNDDARELLAQPGVLAVISFESRCEKPTELGCIPIGLTSLSQKTEEVISLADGLAERGEADGCHWNIIDDIACVATWVPEDECGDIENAACAAYMRLFGVLRDKGFHHVFRIWNFIPNINSGDGDCEEYKKFCVGRQRAFASMSLAPDAYPAASALGHHSGGAVIYALASRATQAVHHENPRQQSAYHYPREYGPISPSFARATRQRLSEREHIFVSGTASIIGHATCAPQSLREQLSITVENIALLLADIHDEHEPLRAIRVYLRHAADYAEALEHLTSVYPEQHMNFLLADICRANLLVEIEVASRIPQGISVNRKPV